MIVASTIAPEGLKNFSPGLNGAKLRILWDAQLPRRGWRTQLKVSTREGKAGRLTYFRKAGHTGIEVVIKRPVRPLQ